MTDNTTKLQLRQTLLKLRQSIDKTTLQSNSNKLCGHLQTFALFKEARTILAYFSVRQEPNLSTLFHLPKTWGFPRCVGNYLVWHQWEPLNSLPLQKGTFGILEPNPEAPLVDSKQVDLILVPALACDRHGYRLGYGGGFYDRLLSSPSWANKPTVGIVFESAYFTELPHDLWDQPLQYVCTENGISECPQA